MNNDELCQELNCTDSSLFFGTGIALCNIFGVKIAAAGMEEIISFIYKNIKKLSGRYICITNVHTTVMSYDDPAYLGIQNRSILSLPDGKPISVICRRRGYKNAVRITGPDLMEKLFEECKTNQLKHYFYGSTQNTLNILQKQLIASYPGIRIAGMHSPPFRTLSEEENGQIDALINEAEPDIIWVGLGAPKQEIWMAEKEGKVKGLMIGVGAGFDFLAHNIKRAPGWMQKLSLEWLYRLLQDPKRLWRRYLYTNSKFIWLLLRGKLIRR